MNDVKRITGQAARKAAEELLVEKRARLTWCKDRLAELSDETEPLKMEIRQLKSDIVHARRIVAPFRERIVNGVKKTLSDNRDTIAGIAVLTPCIALGAGGAALIIYEAAKHSGK